MSENPKFKVNELLDHIDPVEAIEQSMGKSWQDFTDEEQLDFLKSFASFSGLKNDLLKEAGDSHYGSSLEEIENLLTGLGFQLGWMGNHHSPKHGYDEKEAIWCRPDGLVIYLDTFWGGKSANRFDLYGEYQIDDPEKLDDIYHTLGGASASMESYPVGFGIPREDVKSVFFHIDVRDGLRWRLDNIVKAGTLASSWSDNERFMWFLNYDEEDEANKDGFNRNSYLIKKAKHGTPMLKAIMANVIK